MFARAKPRIPRRRGGHEAATRAPLILIAAMALSAQPALACKTRKKGWDTASTVGELTLVGAAVAVPVVRKDWTGLKQVAFTTAANEATTEILKRSIKERRPDCSDRRSMPSGHTSRSFAAAIALQQRYGWEYGAPAVVLATFVGAARVAAHKHHWYDSVAGAAIGTTAAVLLTRRYMLKDTEVAIAPWGDSGGGGVSVAFAF